MANVCVRDGMRAGLRHAEQTGDTLVMVLNNSIDAVEAGRLQLTGFYAPLNLGPRVQNRLEVIFEEIVANIIRYGFKGEVGKGDDDFCITVRATFHPDALDLIIEDNGIAFNPLTAPEPDPFDTLDNARIGGLGIPLVRRMAQSVEYALIAAVPPARPHNRLTIHIARP